LANGAERIAQEKRMVPPPVALSLLLCERVIVDHATKQPSLISVFTGLAVDGFPSPEQRFCLFVPLTSGRGEGTLKLVVNRLDTGEPVYEQQHLIRFPNPLAVVNVTLRLRAIRFPVPGRYEFVLFADSDLVAQRTLHVRQL
jgi:hypothetical protein